MKVSKRKPSINKTRSDLKAYYKDILNKKTNQYERIEIKNPSEKIKKEMDYEKMMGWACF